MKFEDYLKLCQDIHDGIYQNAPYDDSEYLEYSKMNYVRMQRWLKRGVISDELKQKIQKLDKKQNWILITEPWCGDAAHSVPFIHMLSQLNPLITLDIELRDSEPFRIDQYLTNGGKSIPKMVIQDENEHDLWVWGPRPHLAQELFISLKEQDKDFEEIKESIQKWYNEDKGAALQKEFLSFLDSYDTIS